MVLVKKLLVSASLAVALCTAGQPAFAQTALGQPAPLALPAAIEQGLPGRIQSPLQPSALQDLFTNTFTDFRHLGSMETVTWLAIGAMAATTTTRFDSSVTNSVAGSAMARNFRSGNIIGGKEFQFASSLAAYGIGRVSGQRRISDVAGKVFRAQLMAQALTGIVKQTAQRTRPDGADQRSFPSGHTSVSFASATVLQREFGWKVGVPAYAIAASVAAARIEKKKHYLSDVAFGAAIGILSGRTVTIGSGDRKFAVAPAAVAGGVAVNFAWVGNSSH